MKNHKVKRPGLAAGALMVALALAASSKAGTLRFGSTGGDIPGSNAGTMRNGSTGPNGLTDSDAAPAVATSSPPGQVLWTYYETETATLDPCSSVTSSTPGPDHGCNNAGNGDNILRLIYPNGAANPYIVGAAYSPACAMIYVFDDDEEMGECCGCLLTSSQEASFSVENNLTSNFGTPGKDGAGLLAVVVTSSNPAIESFTAPSNGQGCTFGQSSACNFGCDPTDEPGYSVTTANNLLGTITHNQIVATSTGSTSGLTEAALFDNRTGDPINQTYLEVQCGSIVGNGSGTGVCNCPPLPLIF